MTPNYTIELLCLVVNRFKRSHRIPGLEFQPLSDGFEVFKDGVPVGTIRVVNGKAVFNPPLSERDREDCFVTEAELRRWQQPKPKR